MSSAVLTRPAIGALTRKEAVRVLRSPAFPIITAYMLIISGLAVFGAGEDSSGASIDVQEGLLNGLLYFTLLIFGPLTFVAANLVATSSRRSGSDRLFAAAPVSQRRRDLALCFAVVVGPALVATALAGVIAWLAAEVRPVSTDGLTMETMTWIEGAQIPAIVIGAGVLGIAVARWLPFRGAPVLAFALLILGTGWLVADGGGRATRAWFAPYVAIEWWGDEDWHPSASPVWHLVYLLALSGIGVCAVALCQPERRRGWLLAGAAAFGAVVTAGLLQLPS